MAGARAGLLIRVSSGGQDEQNQQPDVEGHAADRGYRVIKRYTLHDKSAWKGEQQEALDQIIADMKAGVIKVLVVWHSDRLDRRGVLEALLFLRQVKEAGGRVESAQEGLLDERNLLTIVNSYMNNQKSEHLSEQVQLAHKRIRENGAFRGRDPFGYEITGPKYNRRLTVIESLRPVVAEIFQRVIDGESLADICLWLDSLEVKTAKVVTKKYQAGDVTPWWPAMLMRLVRHPAYSGRYYVRRLDSETGKAVTYTHKCEAIVSRAVQRQAIEALATREKRGPRGVPERRAMLKDVITCGNPECDATGEHPSPMYKIMARVSSSPARAHERRAWYRCTGRGSQRRGCGTLVQADLADYAVNATMAESWHVPVVVRTLVKGHDWAEEIQAVKDQIRALDPDTMTDEEYDQQLAWLQAERDRLKGLPAEDDEWREDDTDELWSDLYAAVPVWDRGAWLKSHGFTVTARKGDQPGQVRVEVARTVIHGPGRQVVPWPRWAASSAI